ncbi:MAG TPA: hypothetical protein VGN00_05320 [Puia sp.]|jgi:hypothetical protein
MKLALLLCALILSLHGLCAVPAYRTALAITPDHHSIANKKSQEEAGRQLVTYKMTTTMIGWGLITWLTAVIGWAVVVKNSLDKILKDVLQDMARYS